MSKKKRKGKKKPDKNTTINIAVISSVDQEIEKILPGDPQVEEPETEKELDVRKRVPVWLL